MKGSGKRALFCFSNKADLGNWESHMGLAKSRDFCHWDGLPAVPYMVCLRLLNCKFREGRDYVLFSCSLCRACCCLEASSPLASQWRWQCRVFWIPAVGQALCIEYDQRWGKWKFRQVTFALGYTANEWQGWGWIRICLISTAQTLFKNDPFSFCRSSMFSEIPATSVTCASTYSL